MVFITVAVNVVVVPAIANTLSLKDFTDRAMKVVDDSSVGYLNALNYDVAFYSRRTIPIVSQKDPDLPQYLIAWRTLFDALPASKRSRFEIVMVVEPHFARRQRRHAPAPPAPRFSNPNHPNLPTTTSRLKFYDRLSRRISRNRPHQPRQHLCRRAAQADVAYPRDLRFVEIHLDQRSAALLNFERESRRRINRRRRPRHDHQVRLAPNAPRTCSARRSESARQTRPCPTSTIPRIADTTAAASRG